MVGAAAWWERSVCDVGRGVSGVRILVLGAGGRLGGSLVRAWGGEDAGILALDRSGLDFTDLDAIRRKVGRMDFDWVVNCAALTDVDRCEREPELARRVNGEAVEVLAGECAERGGRLLHVSTDYVFEGLKREPYVEGDEAHPVSVYGASKLAGEGAVLKSSERNLVVRVSWVFGPERPSFLDGILGRALEGGDLAAVADKWASPTYTHDAAVGLRALMAAEATGVVHLCNHGGCSWQEYGQHALDCARRAGIRLGSDRIRAIRMSELKAFVAKRPVYSVLGVGRFEAITGLRMRPWREAVEEYVRNAWPGRVRGV